MLPRAALRSLRPGQSLRRPVTVQGSVRAYAKAGKPRATPPKPAHSASSIVSTKHVSPSPRAPSNAERSSPGAAASSDAQASHQNRVPQEKLDNEAVDAMPSTAELGAKSSLGAQAEPTNPEQSRPHEELETQQDTILRSSSHAEVEAEVERAEQEGVELAAEVSAARERESRAGRERPQIPLHDLTKGLPSTIDAELKAEIERAAKDDAQAEEMRAEQAKGSRGDRDGPVRNYTTSAERRWNRMMTWMMASFGFAALVTPIYLGRNWETEEEERRYQDAPNGWGLMLFANRLRARLTSTFDYYSDPAFEKLLPDPDPLYQRPYTLVLSLEDLLVHNEWTREHGWRMAKRPGLDYFLRYLSNYYEIVIFTSVPSMIAAPALQKLDPFGTAPYRLFREATLYKNGQYIKDLSYLNRPLNTIISVDTDPAHTSAQPENAVILPRWKGDPGDKELVALIPFLENVAAMELPDTRKVLESFSGKHIPTEFAIREAEQKKRFNEELARERKSKPRRSRGIGALGSALGIRTDQGLMQLPPGEITIAEGRERGMMPHEVMRARGQRAYELLEQDIRDNAEEWTRQMKEEEEKMREEQMRSMKQGFFGWFGGGKAGEKEKEEKGKGEKK